ncbi:hypothetical protein BKA70DRAFT_1120762 [Coprinopsis sp. MPI-PUGE-AT-0042]|nr:hypothetical protein BKA70DRAFT_1120762 [Coprinopsis sp. MPI-PUGE-AT-0042]
MEPQTLAVKHPSTDDTSSDQPSLVPNDEEITTDVGEVTENALDTLSSSQPTSDETIKNSNLHGTLDGTSHNPDGKKRKQNTQEATQAAYDRWSALIPSLVDPLLRYQRAMYRTVIPAMPSTLSCCSSPTTCVFSYVTIKCLLQSEFQDVTVAICRCRSLPQILVEHGLFPTAPHQPRTAFGIEVLDFFKALFEHSSEAVQALAHALNTYYSRCGFYLYNGNDENTIEPFRKGLGYAIQWYDMLLVEVDRQKEQTLQRALDIAMQPQASPIAAATLNSSTTPPPTPAAATYPRPSSPPTLAPSGTPASADGGLSPGECARFLQELCPLCFGGNMFGRSVEDGADIHVSIDGNFNHRHARAAGDCPDFHRPRHVVSKEEVDRRGDHIEKARAEGKQKQKPSKRRVPDAAIDACEEAHEAGSGSKIKTNLDKFDHGGVMGMICRHDMPLFLANIDTHGEQQKFGVALIEYLFRFIPPHATVIACYDVGCVMDRSRQLYNIFSEGVSERLGFVTTAMHAYAHQWACQVVYAPRMRKGMGLTDGEGIERLWARIRRLIPITRNASARRRLWLLDRAMSAIGSDVMPGLAAALSRKLKNVKKRLESIRKRPTKKLSNDFIRSQWHHQQSAQMSLQSQAPLRVKKELDSVLSLQAEIDSTQKTLESTRKALGTTDKAASTAKSILDQLDEQQQDLAKRAEELYASVNIAEAFPGLEGLQLKFVRGLLMARDMKISIRKRAIGNFFEWDKLKQASGGRTKLHQKARANIQKRAPALTNAIKRFNKKVDQLKDLYKPEWIIPLPDKLPTDLGQLKGDPNLLTDVWVSMSEGEEVPPWLSDPEVREEIAAMHAQDRCSEERVRVGIERDNMCRWFRKEFLAVEIALRSESGKPIAFALMRYKNYLRVLTSRWRGELIAGHALKFWEEDAAAKACHLMGGEAHPKAYSFLEPIVAAPLPSPCEPEDFPDEPEGNGWEVGVSTNDILMDDLLWDKGDSDEEIAPEDESVNTTASEVVGHITSAQPNIPPMDCNIDDDIEVSDPKRPQLNVLDQTLQQLSLPRASLNDKSLYLWEPADIARLESPTARLNSACINSGAALIKAVLSASPSTSTSASFCCIFSTFDLLMVRNGALSDAMWRRTSPLAYWTKTIWILPIHRVHPYQHWVLAVIQLKTGRVFLFDSLAKASHWSDDIEDIVAFIARLSMIAVHHGKHFVQPIPLDIPWDFRSVSATLVQTTSFSCGLWVLASIGAVLSARHTTGLSEADMPSFRRILLDRVRLLPVSSSSPLST